MKKLNVICHIKDDLKRVIPIEHLQDAINVILDFQSGALEKNKVHLDHGDVLDECNCLFAKITTYGKIVLP
jgi:hypothetical protein